MAGFTFRGMVGRVADEDEYEIDDQEQPRHDDPDQPGFL
jgi:hypothetical protein